MLSITWKDFMRKKISALETSQSSTKWKKKLIKKGKREVFFIHHCYQNHSYYCIIDEAGKTKKKKVKKERGTRFIRNHLPPETESQYLIHVKEFLPALTAYYNTCGCPLLLSEQQSLINRFKDQGTGRMKVISIILLTKNSYDNTNNRLIRLKHIFKCMKFLVAYMVE